jgi:hypothetical protein
MKVRGTVMIAVTALIVSAAVATNPVGAADKNDQSVASLGTPRPVVPGGEGMQAFYNITVDGTGATYPWIDATVGTELTAAEGDDVIGPLTWPFSFHVYDNAYADPDVIDVNSNGSLHFDQGGPRTLWVNCGDVPSTIDGQWVAPLGDDLISNSIWYLVTGAAPNRILTIEWSGTNEFSGGGVANLEVSFYESSNDIVVQTQIVTPFAFAADGEVGINKGDGVEGTEVACGALGNLPSSDFDVEFAYVVPVELQSLAVE